MFCSSQIFKACKRIVHESFDGGLDGDIALLVLEHASQFQAPIDGVVPWSDCKNLTAVGWFQSSPHVGPSPHLQILPRLWHVDQKECESVLGKLPSGEICTTTRTVFFLLL